jgi:Galactose oxidase, central domain
VLFGGLDGAIALADTWEWNGEDWTQVADSGPSARSGHAMVFGGARNRVVLFGGEASGTLRQDTWQWDATSGLQVEDVGPAPRRAPSQRRWCTTDAACWCSAGCRL